jgi:hypothetical protein
LPFLVVTVLPCEVLVAGVVVVATGTGEVTAGIETGEVVVSPEVSLPHPAAISPMASASGRRSR